jgi:regulator of nucleoside diphosphate kinase
MHNEHRTRIDSFPEIKITRWDLGRLDHLLGNHSTILSSRVAEFLVRKLMAASVVGEAEVPALTVTMGSRVEYHDEEDATHSVVTVVHPHDLDYYDDAISILSPVGAVLLGLSEGQSMAFNEPAGGLKTITVKKVLYQPEASQRARA